MRWLLQGALASLVAFAHGLSSSGNRLLAIVEDSSEIEKYSQLWDDLKGRGYTISHESPKNDKLALLKHGVRAYDHLILFPAQSKGLGPSLTSKILLDFINKEGNILLCLSGSSATPSSISSLLLEFDITLPPDKLSHTVDHFNYDTLSAAEHHDVLVLPSPVSARPGVKNFFGGDGSLAIPRAVAQSLGPSSQLLNPILKAKATSYSYCSKEEPATSEDPFATGEQIALVSALQARNSARFTVLGSVEALQNKWFDASVQPPKGSKTKTANRDFGKRLTEWTFKELGVLKVGAVRHQLAPATAAEGNKSLAPTANPTIYRVKNDIVFNCELSEYSGTQYVPPKLPAGDELQLEFTMLSPFHRLNLAPVSSSPNSTTYAARFTVPDQHGIFSFRVNYKRPFLTNIEIKEEVTIRHFAHDEFPRSWRISGGWVWILGVWLTVVGWVGFVALWLWSEPVKEGQSVKKTQ